MIRGLHVTAATVDVIIGPVPTAGAQPDDKLHASLHRGSAASDQRSL